MGPSGVTKQLGGAVKGEGERGKVGGAVIRYHEQRMRERRGEKREGRREEREVGGRPVRCHKEAEHSGEVEGVGGRPVGRHKKRSG